MFDAGSENEPITNFTSCHHNPKPAIDIGLTASIDNLPPISKPREAGQDAAAADEDGDDDAGVDDDVHPVLAPLPCCFAAAAYFGSLSALSLVGLDFEACG